MLLISKQKPLKLIYPPSNIAFTNDRWNGRCALTDSDPTETRARISQPRISQRLRSKDFHYVGTIISLFVVWTVNLAFLLLNLLYNRSGSRKSPCSCVKLSVLHVHDCLPCYQRTVPVPQWFDARRRLQLPQESSSSNGVNHASAGVLSSEQMLVGILICVIGAK